MYQDSGINLKRFLKGTLAFVLALLLVVTIVLGNAVVIRVNRNISNDAELEASQYLMESISYANENAFGRARHLVKEQFNFLNTYSTYEKHYNKAEILIVQGKYIEAVNELNLSYLAADDVEGDTQYIKDDIWVKKGCLYALLNDYDSALQSFQNVSLTSEFAEDVLVIETQIFLETSKSDAAISELEEYLQIKENVMLRQTLAEIYYMETDYQHAGENYSMLLAETSQSMEYYHLMRGICYEQTGEYRSAVEDFTTAVENGYEDTSVCYEHMALSHYMLGNDSEVLKYGEMAAFDASDEVRLYSLFRVMGLSCLRTGEYQTGVDYFTKGIEGDETLTDIYYYRGVCLMAESEFDAAAQDFTKAIEKGVQTAFSCYNRGICYMQTGFLEESKRDFLMVLDSECEEGLKASAQLLIDGIG